jgi:hypothetical protein
MKMPLRHIFACAVLLGFGLGVMPLARAAEEPSLQEVNSAVRAGHLAEAQSMMETVLRDHPNSAKAHFVDAEVLVRMARVEDARRELARAEQLEPGLASIKPETVQDLRGRLGVQGTLSGVAPASPAAGGVPWGPVMILLAVGLLIFLVLRARRSAMAPGAGMVPASPYGGVGGAGGVPYGAPPMGGPGIGSGIVGGLATGAAVGAGMVAGEALAHEFIGHHDRPAGEAWTDNGARVAAADNADLGVDGGWDSGGSSDFASGIGGDDWG